MSSSFDSKTNQEHDPPVLEASSSCSSFSSRPRQQSSQQQAQRPTRPGGGWDRMTFHLRRGIAAAAQQHRKQRRRHHHQQQQSEPQPPVSNSTSQAPPPPQLQQQEAKEDAGTTVLACSQPSQTVVVVTTTTSSLSTSSSCSSSSSSWIVLMDSWSDWMQAWQAVWDSTQVHQVLHQSVVVVHALQACVWDTVTVPGRLVVQTVVSLPALVPRGLVLQQPRSLDHPKTTTPPKKKDKDDETTRTLASSVPPTAWHSQALGWLVHATHQVTADVCSLCLPSPQTRRRRLELPSTQVLQQRLALPAIAEPMDSDDSDDDEQQDKDHKDGAEESNLVLSVADLGLVVMMQGSNHVTDQKKDDNTKNNDPQEDGDTTNMNKQGQKRVTQVDLRSHGLHDDNGSTIVEQALDLLVARGLTLVSSHASVQLRNPTYHSNNNNNNNHGWEWKCQGSTQAVLKRLQPQSVGERLQTLQRETLLWSSTMTHVPGGSSFPMYLARGMIPLAPYELVQLLWDNDRTNEYNAFSLGRTTLLTVPLSHQEDPTNKEQPLPQAQDHPNPQHDDHPQSIVGQCKVIESETRVPFTQLSVHVTCLMHCRRLLEPHDHGYVIVSRSVGVGPTGVTHARDETDKSNQKDGTNDNAEKHSNKQQQQQQSSSRRHRRSRGRDTHANKNNQKKTNQIVWGVNVIRSVPNHPEWTDLTSLSQMEYSLGVVPQFLASQIALKGVSEFFDTMRKRRPQQTNK